MFCKNCGAKLRDGEMFCPNCGTKQDVVAQPQRVMQNPPFQNPQGRNPQGPTPPFQNQQGPTPPFQNPPFQNPPIQDPGKGNQKSRSKNPIFIAGGAVAVILVLAIIIGIAKKPSAKKTDFVLYERNDEMYLNFLSDKDKTSQKLTTDFNSGYYGENSMTVHNKKKNYLFFPDKCNENGVSLYYVNLNEKKAEKRSPVKLDTNVVSYRVVDAGDTVYYKTNNDILYKHDLENKEKLASDVNTYFIDRTADIFVYTVSVTSGDETYYDYYSVNSKGKSSQIISGASYAHYVDKDYKIITFVKDGTIYALENGTKLHTICTVDALKKEESIYVVYADASHAYYQISSSESVYASDFITDNSASSDANLTAPDKNDQKYWETWEEGWGGPRAKTYTEQYHKELEAFEAKQNRDRVRSYMEEMTLYGVSNTRLYYYDGSKIQTLTEHLNRVENKDGKIVYTVYDLAESKLDLVDIVGKANSTSQSDVRTYIDDNVNPSLTAYVAIDGNSTQLLTKERFGEDGEKVENYSTSEYRFGFDNDGNYLYYINESNEDGVGTLYKRKVNGSGLNAEETVYSDVAGYMFDNSNNIITFRDSVINKNGSYSSNDLYVNNKKIDTDVVGSAYLKDGVMGYTNYVRVSDDNTLTYQIAYSPKDYTGTLRQYAGKDAITIANDIRSWSVVGKDKIFYIDNYDTDSYDGTLRYYDNGEKREISSYVSFVINPREN